MSHIQQQKALYAKNKQAIMAHLKMNELSFHMLQFEAGMDYVEQNNPSEFDRKMLSESPIFWSWWINQWNLRDSILVPTLFSRPGQFSEVEYKRIHNPKFIDKHPSRFIMDESFALMIEKLNESHYASK